METLTKSILSTVKTYQMHLASQYTYYLTSVNQAKSLVKAWCRLVQMGSKRFGAWYTDLETFAG